MGDPLYLLAVLAMAAVVVVLILGLGGFAKGGVFNHKYANKLMQMRLLFQFIAVVLLVAYVYFRGQGGL